MSSPAPVDGSMEASYAAEQPISSSGSRLPQSPRRPTHLLPPRLNIAPTSELGPPAQVQVWRNAQRPASWLLNVLFLVFTFHFVYIYFYLYIYFKILKSSAYPSASPVGRQSPDAHPRGAGQFRESVCYVICTDVSFVFKASCRLLLFLSTSLMTMTGWFPARRLWCCRSAPTGSTRRSSESQEYVNVTLAMFPQASAELFILFRVNIEL